MSLGRDTERTPRAYNLDLMNVDDCDALDGWFPELEPVDARPAKLIGFNYARSLTGDHSLDCLHFFLDDYQFERVWLRPFDYVSTLRKFGCVLTPDFSLYTDMPVPMRIWNMYRSRVLGAWWQRLGLTVIPTLQWSDGRTRDWDFDGLPENSTVAVSTVGVRSSKEATRLWLDGFRRAMAALRPNRVLMYGRPVGGFVPPEGVEIVHYANSVTERMEESHGRKRVGEPAA